MRRRWYLRRILCGPFLGYLYQFVQLYAQTPFGVLFDELDHFVGVAATAGLQVFVLAVEVAPLAKVLSLENDFQFVAVGQYPVRFGAEGHPVDVLRQRVCTVGLNLHKVAMALQQLNKRLVYP